ncbi:MAG: hypothetical protein NUV80_06505 [Candidatus Berkelbacteria bacterium]|nr:hypothetical protein [Candidatus Berkelbacteria bacterium]
MIPRIYLSRRNLNTLLTKLNQVAAGKESFCTIIKWDNKHKVYPQTHPIIVVTAVEDDEYYVDRKPGLMKEDLE